MNLPSKIKRAFYVLAISGLGSWVAFSPLFASASIFSFFAYGASQEQTSTFTYNSQTLPLLASAINIDPHPSIGGGDITLVAGQALLAQEGPSGTAADLTDTPPASSISVYVVHDGDTLSGIAQMFGVSVNTIVWANNIKGHIIHPGDSLIILPITGVRYTVAKGDTLASVAKKFSSDAGEIAQYNDLADNAPLTAGGTIIIPNGEVTAPVSSAPIARRSSSRVSSEPYLGGSGPALSDFFMWPVASGIVTQGLHGWNAIDIGARSGTSIYAAAAGTVIIAKSNGAWNGGYGNYVVISHPNGTQTLYAHMNKVLASAGQAVAQGDTIGKVGATGLATGSHLHFEVRGAANPFAVLALGGSE